MTFLGPGFFAAAALVLPLVAIFLLKVRPRRRPVTAYFLWDRVFVEKKSSALFNRLRDTISLILLLIALSAAVLAAARPLPANADARDLLVIVDDSASMGATRGRSTQTKLDRAKQEAVALIGSVSENRRGAVATISDGLRMRQFLTSDRSSLRRAIDAIQITTLPSLESAARPLQGLAQLGEELRVVVITDASPASLGVPNGIDILGIDSGVGGEAIPESNAGFTAAEVVRVPGSDEISIFFRVEATADLEGSNAEVAVERDGAPIKIIPITLAAAPNARNGQPKIVSTVVTTARGPTGAYRLRLTLTDRDTDALRADDTVTLVAHAPEPVRVAVSNSARYFFENAVLAFQQSEGVLQLATGTETPDLRLDRGDETGPARLGAIVFAPSSDSRWIATKGDAIPTPIPRLVARDHPAFRFVPVESLPFDGATEVSLPEGAAVLVEDQAGTPLVWQIRATSGANASSALVFNADPARNDFFLSPYFPLVVRGAAAYLSGRGIQPRSTYATGDRAEIPGHSPNATARLSGPIDLEGLMESPEATDIAGTSDRRTPAFREVAFGDRPKLTEPGYYRAETPNGRALLAASLLHPSETRVEPAGELPPVEGLQRGSPWWVRLAFVAAALLVVEEILYHRRKVG